MSIPNSLTTTSKGDRKLLIYIATAGLSAEFGRCLMLDLSGTLEASLHLFWNRQWYSIFPAVVSPLILGFRCSALCKLTLLRPITLAGGPLTKFNWLQATFFFFRWPTSGIHVPIEVYQPTLWPDELEGLTSSQGSHLSLFPATAAKPGFILTVYSSGNHPLVNCVPNYNRDMPSDW